MRRLSQGFTLIELMVTLVMLSILAAIAVPGYQAYIRLASASQAQQEMQKISEQLERHKARNFSYKGFDPSYIYGTTNLDRIEVPYHGASPKYIITLADGDDPTRSLKDQNATGLSWRMLATVQQDPQNYNFLLDSRGLRCKTRTTLTITATDCGNSGSSW